MVGISP